MSINDENRRAPDSRKGDDCQCPSSGRGPGASPGRGGKLTAGRGQPRGRGDMVLAGGAPATWNSAISGRGVPFVDGRFSARATRELRHELTHQNPAAFFPLTFAPYPFLIFCSTLRCDDVGRTHIRQFGRGGNCSMGKRKAVRTVSRVDVGLRIIIFSLRDRKSCSRNSKHVLVFSFPPSTGKKICRQRGPHESNDRPA